MVEVNPLDWILLNHHRIQSEAQVVTPGRESIPALGQILQGSELARDSGWD